MAGRWRVGAFWVAFTLLWVATAGSINYRPEHGPWDMFVETDCREAAARDPAVLSRGASKRPISTIGFNRIGLMASELPGWSRRRSCCYLSAYCCFGSHRGFGPMRTNRAGIKLECPR